MSTSNKIIKYDKLQDFNTFLKLLLENKYNTLYLSNYYKYNPSENNNILIFKFRLYNTIIINNQRYINNIIQFKINDYKISIISIINIIKQIQIALNISSSLKYIYNRYNEQLLFNSYYKNYPYLFLTNYILKNDDIKDKINNIIINGNKIDNILRDKIEWIINNEIYYQFDNKVNKIIQYNESIFINLSFINFKNIYQLILNKKTLIYLDLHKLYISNEEFDFICDILQYNNNIKKINFSFNNITNFNPLYKLLINNNCITIINLYHNTDNNYFKNHIVKIDYSIINKINEYFKNNNIKKEVILLKDYIIKIIKF